MIRESTQNFVYMRRRS